MHVQPLFFMFTVILKKVGENPNGNCYTYNSYTYSINKKINFKSNIVFYNSSKN